MTTYFSNFFGWKGNGAAGKDSNENQPNPKALIPYQYIRVVHDVENCLLSKGVPKRTPDGRRVFDNDKRLQFSNTNSTVDAGTVYIEVLRAALTPALGQRVASELNIMEDLCATHVTYTIVNKANDTSLFAPTDKCLAGFHMLRGRGVVIENYDKDADTKIRQVLNCHIEVDPAQSTLLVLVSGDRDFSDVIITAQKKKFDMVIIHSTDAHVNPTLRTLVRSADRVMPVWNLIEKKARDAAAERAGVPVGATVGTPDRTPSSRSDPAASKPSLRTAGPEEAVVSVAAEKYLTIVGTKDIYDALSALHCRLVNTKISLAKPADGGHAHMYMGATFEGDDPVTNAPSSHRIKATIEDCLKSIGGESVEIQGMSRSTFDDDKATLMMAKKAGVALYLDKEPDPLQPNALFIEGPKTLLGSKVLVTGYCENKVNVPVENTYVQPLDQEGLADGFVRVRVTLKPSADNGFPKLKSACLAYGKDKVKFSDSVVARGSGGQVAASKLDPINKNWVFAVVEKRIGGEDAKAIKLFCKDKRFPMYKVDVKEQDQALAQAGFCIARCKPDTAGPGDPASDKAAVEKCLKARERGIRFFKDAMRVPTKAPQIDTDDVSVKVNLAFHERNNDAAERVKKHLMSKARTSATIYIQPSLMAITRAAWPILKAEVLRCGIKGDDFYFHGEAHDSQEDQAKPATKAASGQIIIKGSLDAVNQAKAALGKRLGLLPAAKAAAGRHEVGVMVRSVDVPKAFETNQNLGRGVSHALNAFFSQFAMDDGDDDDAKSTVCGSVASSHEEDEEEQALEAPIVWTVESKQKVKISITSLVPEDAEAAGEQEERVDRAVAVADKYIREFQESSLQQSDFRGFSNFANKDLHLNVRKTFDVFVFYSCGNSSSQGGPQPAGDPLTVMAIVETKKFSHYSKLKDFCETHLSIDVWSVQYRQEDQPTSSGLAIYSIILNRKSGSGAVNKLLSFKEPGTGVVGFFKTLAQCNSHLQAQSGPVGDGKLVVFGRKEAVDEAVDFIKEEAKGCAPSSHVLCAEDKRVAWVLVNPVNETKRNKFIDSVKKACQAKSVSQVNLSAVSASGVRGELMKIVGQANSVTSATAVANSEVEKLADSMKSTEVKFSQHEFAFLTTEKNGIKKRLEDTHGVIISAQPTKATSKKPVQKILATAQLGSVAIEVREGDLLDSGSEAIVNPANGRLAHGAGAAAAIRMAAGGDEFDQLCSSALDALVRARSPKVGGDGELLVGGALTTGPCQLSSKGVKVVVHAVGPFHRTGSQAEENSFLSAIRAAFEEVVNAGCKSVSLPLMGAGVYSWSPKDSANIMLLALSQAVAQYGNSSPITHIVLVDFLPAHATAFKEALSSYAAGSSGPGTGDVPRPQVVVPRAPEFSWYWEKFGDWVAYDYDQVMQIERAIRDGSLPATITGDVAGQFSDSKNKPAGAHAPVYAVSKEPTAAPDGKTYEFRQVNVASNFFRAVKREPFKAGDVMHGYTPQTWAAPPPSPGAKSFVTSFTRQLPIPLTSVSVSGADSASSTAQSSLGAVSAPSAAAATHSLTLFGFPPNVDKCKDALQKNMEREWQFTDVDLSKTGSEPWADVLDLVKLEADRHMAVITQADEATRIVKLKALGKVQLLTAASAVKDVGVEIMTKALEDEMSVTYPKEWEPAGGPRYNEGLFDVAKDSEEWHFVEGEFKSGRGIPNKLVKVQRVQNAFAWDGYYLKVKMLASSNRDVVGKDLFKRANERWMKHGTRNTEPQKLFDHHRGLDYAYSSEGCFFGTAGYTAEDAAYSHGYRYNVPGGKLAQMFLVRVAAGRIQEIAVRTAEHRQMKHPDKGFDTGRGDVSGGMMAIMVYEPYLAYPAYLLTYEL